MNIAIIEVWKMDALILTDFLKCYTNEKHLLFTIHTFESRSDFLNLFEPYHYDIIFLDTDLKDANGIALAGEIRKTDMKCNLIFITSNARHAVESYRVRASDYLLKPISYELFSEAMNYCIAEKRFLHPYIEVKEGRILVKILLDDILYSDYHNHYIQIHTRGRIVKSYMSFPEFSPLLLSFPQFICCYRNCILNMDAVVSMTDTDFLLTTGESIPFNRSKRNQIRQRFSDYQFEKTCEAH